MVYQADLVVFVQARVLMEQSAISATELAARWAYAELVSPRFADGYVKLTHPLRVKAAGGVAFSSLSNEEVETLRAMLENHHDRGGMYPLLVYFPRYAPRSWEYDQLRDLSVMGGLGWSRFSDFEKGEALTPAAEEVHAKLKDKASGPFVQSDGPIIVVPCHYNRRPFQLLLEGTFRSLLFARDRSETTRLRVWVPSLVGPELQHGPPWL